MIKDANAVRPCGARMFGGCACVPANAAARCFEVEMKKYTCAWIFAKAVEFLRCLGVAERTNSSSRCSQLTQRSTWASAQNTGLGSIPFIDASRIYIAGYSLGGNVALHVAALDQQVRSARFELYN